MMNKKIILSGFILGMSIMSLPLYSNAANENPRSSVNVSVNVSNQNQGAESENASESEDGWYYLAADDKYGKFFNPDSVKVVKKVTTSNGKEIPTEIEAWTKTTYSPEGAILTINSYEIQSFFPDPEMLSYSLALLRINPQNRTIQYATEDFYDKNGKVVWSQSDGRIKEVNSQSFEEDFYAAIVDEIFRHGEVDRKLAPDRWIDLWTFTDADGNTTTVTADTTTMRLKGSNLILWEWQETKNAQGNVVEIRFMKKAVNLFQGTEKISSGDVWTPQSAGWNNLNDEHGGAYRMIRSDEPDYKGLVRLRAFAKGYSKWVNRYSIDLIEESELQQ
ncbi:MAG: hypothetical protein IJ563_03045 [Selenomonadaceae bacterium]|nr:hypothetical protein [Selenomonadaceae bacterium]MBR1859870.1 hypothetical protein [Selenomonadaceae bacterium]